MRVVQQHTHDAHSSIPPSTPAKSRFQVMSGHFNALPAAKRPRLSEATLSSGSGSSSFSDGASVSAQQLPHSLAPPIPSTSPIIHDRPLASSSCSFGPEVHSLTEAEVYATHETRTEMHEALKAGKASSKNYSRHVTGYETYWPQYQFERLQQFPELPSVPAHPITATKVAIFLKYECNRRKNTADSGDGSTVGIESIKQCISALEHYRFHHQHEPAYAQCAEAQKPLRTDARIKQFEISKKASEPERIMAGQKSKAKGTSSDTYTVDELKRSSMWCLKGRKSAKKILLGARDRCMLLLSTNTAFRGDSTRSLLFSDISIRDVPMPELSDYASGGNAVIEALIALRDQGKHIQDGRVEEHAAFRHRDVELCCVGGAALYFFAIFHIAGREVPDFAPDFTNPDSGDFGHRSWYALYMFPGSNGDDSGLSYKQHLNRVNLIQARNEIIISSKTHAGRKFTVKNIRDNRASQSEAKSVGRWRESGNSAYDRYDHSLPIQGMLAAASFNGQRPETYMIPRNCLEPPAELMAVLFPWAEDEQAKMKARREVIGALADDYALKGFLDFLIRARRILLQDAAVLFTKHPDCGFFKYAPFNSPVFHDFAARSSQAILDVETRFRENMKNLPMHVADTFRGVVRSVGMEQQMMMDQINMRFKAVESMLTQVVLSGAGNSRKRKREVQNSITPSIPPAIPLPTSTYSNSNSADPSRTTQEGLSSIPLHPDGSSSCPHAQLAPSYQRPASPSRTVLTASALATFNPGVILRPDPPEVDPERSAQHAAMTELGRKYGEERVQRHQWDWVDSTSSATPARFLPRYVYARRKRLEGGKDEPLSVDDIWHEHVVGLDGQLSISQLNDGWGGSWKRNIASEKSEGSRRAKLVALIQELSKRPNWTSELALRFLRERYPIERQSPFPHLRTTRSFMEWLQRTKDGNNYASVLESASLYHRA